MNNQKNDFFGGRKLLIASKHKKESVIKPLLEEHLGVLCETVENFDTDIFGTFSGETERKDDPLTTVKKKCEKAMQSFGFDLAVASEGSFGPHPSFFFISADDELLILIDAKNKFEITAREISTATNFNGKFFENEDDVKKFAEQVLFPSHALIVRQSRETNDHLIKGITNWDDLIHHFYHFKNKYGRAFIETDMRAMNNPTRMSVIKKATEQLIQKINSACAQCGAPGFDISTINRGLPCDWCGAPTNGILSYLYQCKKCGYQKEEMYPHNKTKADPGSCNFCNP